MSTGSTPSGYAESFPERDLELPEDLRDELAKPMGEFVDEGSLTKHLKGAPRVVSVGDVVTVTLLRAGMVPDVAVFDYRTKRSELASMKEHIAGMPGRLVKVENPPGRITRALWRAVRDAVNGRDTVKVEVSGEEDLAALVAIATGPQGTQVLYGIPDKGMVAVRVGPESRAFAAAAIERMTR